jgi:hypothetical protein
MLLSQLTGGILPKLQCRLNGVLTCFVQVADFDLAEIQMRRYGRRLSATGERLFVILLFTPTEPAQHICYFEQKILKGGVLNFVH